MKSHFDAPAAMRKISAKQRNIAQRNAQWRREYVLERGHCALCGCKEGVTHADGHYAMTLCVHELCPGAFRLKSIEQGRNACMVVCWFCNSVKLPGMPLAKQIAIKAKDERRREYWPCGLRKPITESTDAPKVLSIIDAVRAVKDNGRQPRIVEVSDVLDELQKLGS